MPGNGGAIIPENPKTAEDYLRRAIHLASTHSADGRHGPFGALVVRDDEILGEGWNQVVASSDPTAHAEVMAIREACRNLGTHDLSGATLYASCEPCPMCLAAIHWARIRRVVYAASAEDAAGVGFDDARIMEEMGRGWARGSIPGKRLLPTEGRAVLEAWDRNPNRVDY